MKLAHFLKTIEEGTCPEGELRIRDIYDFSVEDADLNDILDALKQPNNVRKIFLESSLSADGIQKLAQFLEHNKQIESLELWNEQFGFRTKNDIIDCFVPVLQNNKTLKRLKLSGVGVQHANTAALFKTLEVNHTLEHLTLYDNRFVDFDTAYQIAEMIFNNKTLKSLDLNGHYFKAADLAIIVAALQSNETLDHLDLSGHQVNNEGAILFADALAQDIHLKSLKLFNSEITAYGAVALANSLVTNTHLNKLDINGNSINTAGTLAFAKALEQNRALRELSIGVYSANGKGVTAFADMLERNTSLIKFDYNSSYTSGDSRDKSRIDKALARNKTLKQQEEQAIPKSKPISALLQQRLSFHAEVGEYERDNSSVPEEDNPEQIVYV